MRNTFADVITELAKERSDVCLLSGDIGNRMFDRFKAVAPDRFINCGIAEANMMSMAAGMGLSGLKPVVYTITPFTTTRCLEQIRTGVAYHESPVVIVGTGSGLSYAELGATHHSLEDIAVLKSIPNLQICAPSDPAQLAVQLRDAIENSLPTYIRIGKKGEPNLLNSDSDLSIGKAQMIRSGEKYLVLSVGPITSEALKAAEHLALTGINVAVAAIGTIKPLDTQFLFNCLNQGFTKWVTYEEHNKIGGFGSSIIEWLSDEGIRHIDITRLGINDDFIHQLGTQDYVRRQQSICHESLIKAIQEL